MEKRKRKEIQITIQKETPYIKTTLLVLSCNINSPQGGLRDDGCEGD